MKMSTFRTLAGAIALALTVAPLAALAQIQHYSRTPSAQEIVDQLDPPKTRGLVPGAATKATERPAAPTAPPSISLQIQFDFDSDRIGAESTAALDNLAKALQDERLKGQRFDVIGHTDASGSFGYNMNLSQRRANAVKGYLVNRGVEPQRLKTLGKGPGELLNPARPNAAENRRVQISVSG
jgi:outer membrane protein OmpA-like peptidoglycan-associated protein